MKQINLDLSRDDLSKSFKIDKQKIEVDDIDCINDTLLDSIEKIVNNHIYNRECFKVTVKLEYKNIIDIFPSSDTNPTRRICKQYQAFIEDIIDYNFNSLIDGFIEIGKYQ